MLAVRMTAARAAATAARISAASATSATRFLIGDTVSYTDKHVRERIGTIVRLNQKTASTFTRLREVVDLEPSPLPAPRPSPDGFRCRLRSNRVVA